MYDLNFLTSIKNKPRNRIPQPQSPFDQTFSQVNLTNYQLTKSSLGTFMFLLTFDLLSD